MYHILICDDDLDIVNALKIYLKSADSEYVLHEAYNGLEALEIVQKEEIHLILMDIMMPKMDGISAMNAIREFSNVPIILLTAKSEDMDKILGLTLGADDYITKPFHPIELSARVKSQLRRYLTLGGGHTSESNLMVGGIVMDDLAKLVTVDGEVVSLTPKEYEILKLFLQNPNRVFSPKQIYEAVWKEPQFGSEGTIAVHIRHLREKIEINPSEPRYITVVFGQGYLLAK